MSKQAEFYSMSDLGKGIQRNLAPGLDASIFPGDNSMLSVVSFAANAEGSLHEHPEEQWGIMLEGTGTRIQDGKEYAVKAGDFWRTPGNVPHTFRAGPDGARVLDVFAPAREAYRKAGSGFSSS